jgi:hypothetical protein
VGLRADCLPNNRTMFKQVPPEKWMQYKLLDGKEKKNGKLFLTLCTER